MNKLLGFFREIKAELFEKTSWPNRDDVLNVTVAVISSLVVVSVMLYFVDKMTGVAIRWTVVENVREVKRYINEFTFLVFIFFMIFLFYFLAKWSKR